MAPNKHPYRIISTRKTMPSSWFSNSTSTAITTSSLSTFTTTGGTGSFVVTSPNSTLYNDFSSVDDFTAIIDSGNNIRSRCFSFDESGGVLKLLAGGSGRIEMPDGSSINIDELGNYTIKDKDLKVKYKANLNREFNKYVNASELLADFVRDLGKIGVTQSKVLKTPIELFINWLVHKAADADDDAYSKRGIPTLEESKDLLPAPRSRCKFCQRYLSKKHEKLGMNYCNPVHMDKYALKIGMVFK